MQEWTIGDVVVRAAVEEASLIPGPGLLMGMDVAELGDHLHWLQPDYMDGEGNIQLAIQSFLVESSGQRIVVDTCFGDGHQLPYDLPLDTRHYPGMLASVGFGVDDVDVVLCTHLHFDHVGWNTTLVDGSWQPTFPNAEYLFGAEEYDHWRDDPDPNRCSEECVQTLVDCGAARLVAHDHVITPEVRLVPTPGHTPGHVSVRIESRGQSALITGDMVHHPIQIVRPDWSSGPDYDPETAIATRRQVFSELADTDVLVLGTHFNEPAGGRVRTSGDGLTWAPAKG